MTIKEQLTQLPEQIKNEETQLTHLLDEINKTQETMTKLENEVYTQVEETIDNTGKKMFSNDTKRKTETGQRLKQLHNYNSLKTVLDQLNKNKKLTEIQIGFLKRSFRSAESITRLGE